MTRGTFTRALAGRLRELSMLRLHAEDARRGRGHLVVLTGDPGIGKTRLSQELTGIALAAGLRVAWGRCAEGPGVPPLWPWREVLRSLGLPHEGLVRAEVERPQERFELFDDLCHTLTLAAGQGRGVVIVVDDAHWADEASLLVLRHLAPRVSESPMLLVVNQRPTDPGSRLSSTLAAVSSAPGVEQINLRGLTVAEVAEQLALGGSEAGHARAALLQDLTGGNPFFVAELAAAVEAGEWDVGQTPPLSVLEVVRARAAALGIRCRELLGLAAVAGRDIDAELLAAASGLPIEDCLELLDDAVALGLVEQSGFPGRLRFVHALTRDAMVGSLDQRTRMEHHRALARVLEGDDNAEERCAALAEHWTALAPVVGPDPARRWTTLAAAYSVRRLAYEDGARLYRAALVLGGAGEEERCQLLLGLAKAAYLAGDLGGCADAAREAGALARAHDRTELLADAALVVEACTDEKVNAAARGLCDEAMASLEPSTGAGLRARLLAQRSHIAFYDGEFEVMRRLSEEALAVARASSDDEALIDALRARQEASPGPQGRAERARLAEEMVAVADRAANSRAAMWGHLWAVDTLVEQGELSAAATRLERFSRAADEVGGPVSAWLLDRCTACIAHGRGDLATAASASRRAYDRMRTLEPEAAHGAYLAMQCAISHHWGATEDGVALAEAPYSSPALFVSMRRTGRAFLLARADKLEAAAVEYELAGPPATWAFPPFYVLPGLVVGALAAAALRRHDDVRALLARIEPFRGQHVVGGAGVVIYLGPVELHLGTLALELGHLDEAVEALGTAVRLTEQGGAVGFLAEARHHLATALAARNRRGDAERAATLATASRRTIRALELNALSTASAALADRVAARGAQTVLSVREEEVAALVSEGLTNRQIAERLLISERTAQNHVQHILTKLGFSSRSQIASWKARSWQ